MTKRTQMQSLITRLPLLALLPLAATIVGCASTAPSDYEMNKSLGLRVPDEELETHPPVDFAPGAKVRKTPDKVITVWRFPDVHETYVREGGWMYVELEDGDWESLPD